MCGKLISRFSTHCGLKVRERSVNFACFTLYVRSEINKLTRLLRSISVTVSMKNMQNHYEASLSRITA